MSVEQKRVPLGHSWTELIPENQRGLSGSTLKMIAIVSMVIDHFAASVFAQIYHLRLLGEGAFFLNWDPKTLFYIYKTMRYIGRVAFPIYCFLLIEGIYRTKNKSKYVMRLFLFALVSEIPFDLALFQRPFEWSHQNVFFELAVGVLTVWAIQILWEKTGRIWIPFFACTTLSCVIAQLTHLDYGLKGILCIVLLFLFSYEKKDQMLAGAVGFAWELTAPIAFAFIWFYNGKRGLKLKYFFYLVYPVHLLILAYLCRMLYK